MRKSLIITSIVFLSAAFLTSAFASEYTKFSKKFIKKMRDCDAYEETVTSNYDGNSFTTKRKIIGWRNGFCKYQEVISSNEGKYQLDCGFSDAQVDDLYNAMRSRSRTPEKYTLQLFEPKKNPKTGETTYVRGGTTVIKGNKAYIQWAKLQNNPYFCQPTKL